jgi:hypothetical protein
MFLLIININFKIIIYLLFIYKLIIKILTKCCYYNILEDELIDDQIEDNHNPSIDSDFDSSSSNKSIFNQIDTNQISLIKDTIDMILYYCGILKKNNFFLNVNYNNVMNDLIRNFVEYLYNNTNSIIIKKLINFICYILYTISDFISFNSQIINIIISTITVITILVTFICYIYIKLKRYIPKLNLTTIQILLILINRNKKNFYILYIVLFIIFLIIFISFF